MGGLPSKLIFSVNCIAIQGFFFVRSSATITGICDGEESGEDVFLTIAFSATMLKLLKMGVKKISKI